MYTHGGHRTKINEGYFVGVVAVLAEEWGLVAVGLVRW